MLPNGNSEQKAPAGIEYDFNQGGKKERNKLHRKQFVVSEYMMASGRCKLGSKAQMECGVTKSIMVQ